MGLAGAATPTFAQYPTYNNNTGPSSYPIQQQTEAGYQLTNWQDSVPSVPAPAQGHYAVPAPSAPQVQHVAPLQSAQPYSQPAPTGHQPGQMTYGQQPTQMTYGHQQSIAPGCTSCGNAPVSQGYASSCGPAPYAYSAPSIGSSYGCEPGYAAAAGRQRRLGNGLPTGAKPYFFGAGVLIFRRIDDYNRELSHSDATGAGILSTRDAAMRTSGGVEFMFGRYFNCGKNAISASYWGIFPEDQMVARTGAAGDYRPTIFRPVASPEYQMPVAPAAAPGTDSEIYTLYDDATTHRLRRSNNFHNVEINLLGFGVGCASRSFNKSTAGTMFSGSRHGRGHRGGHGFAGNGGYAGDCGSGECGGCEECGSYDCGGECCGDTSRYATGPCGYVAPQCGSRLNLSWLAGVRYFQFDDRLEYAALGMSTAGYTTNVLSYDVATRNRLVGFQVGGRADYCMGARANLYSMAKTGIYGNSAELDSRLGTENYVAYASGNPAMPFQFSRSTNQLAFLTEIGAGGAYRFTPKWSVTSGYRAVIASGVATAVGNVRTQGQTVSGTGIHAQDYIVLHGLDIGALYNY
jgi:Putative beta barrel porin-7 (BBP7)